MDPAYAKTVRELLAALAAGAEPPVPQGGGLMRVFKETGATSSRGAVGLLADRWFRSAPQSAHNHAELPLNRSELGESEKLHATLSGHIVGQCRWQELSSNESTFYRYRRQAITAFSERLWSEIVDQPRASNPPLPAYQPFIAGA